MKLPCLVVMVLGYFAAAVHASDVLPDRALLPVVMPQAIAMQRQFPQSFDCSELRAAYVQAGWPTGNGPAVVQQIDARLKRQLVLRPDRGADQWRPLASTIVQGRQAAGDCDELSVTSVQMAVCAGIPAEHLGLLITTSPNRGPSELHMVAFFREAGGRIWIFGDSLGTPRPLSRLKEEILYFSRLPDIRRWYTHLTDRPSQLHGTSSTPGRP